VFGREERALTRRNKGIRHFSARFGEDTKDSHLLLGMSLALKWMTVSNISTVAADGVPPLNCTHNAEQHMLGIIKKLCIKDFSDSKKNFGFISCEGMAKDLFFHASGLVGVQFDELREGDGITFETEESPKGMNAVNVQRI
jgi:CspA family cold shock protein